MCDFLEVSRSGYYAWRARAPSRRSQRRRELLEEIREIHGDRDMKSYGSPRVHQELVSRGHEVSENTVARLMCSAGIRAASVRKYRVTTDSNHSHPVSENVLNREFQQSSPDRAWVADITCIPTGEGWLYLACVLDALRMALGRRRPDQEAGLLHHSDRSSQYASAAFQQLLQEARITCSMSRRGNCWDNAMMESFFASKGKPGFTFSVASRHSHSMRVTDDWLQRRQILNTHLKWTPVFGPLVKVDSGWISANCLRSISWRHQEEIDGAYTATF